MTVSAIMLKRALICVRFPADRSSILATLRESGAPQEIVDVVSELPDRTFASSDDVSRETAKV